MNRIPEKYFVTGEKLTFSDEKIDGCFEQAKREAPDDHFVLERVGRHYRLCRHFDKAIPCLQKANELCPMPFPCHHLGLAYMAMADKNIKKGGDDRKTKEWLTEAGKWLEEADKLGKKAAYRITADLARVYVKLEEYQKALCCFKRAAEENTATDDGISLVAAGNYENWGKCFLLLGKEEEGKTKLLKAVECAARVKYHRRTAFSELVKLMQMQEHDRPEVKIDKLNELAKLHELVSSHRKALDLRQSACELDPSNPNTLLGLIEHCCKRRNYALAQVYPSFLQNLTDIPPPKELFLQVKLNAVTTTEPSLAYKIFQETFQFIFPVDCLSDVFIYSADNDKEIACTITRQCEEYFGLTCLCLHRDLHSMLKISETVEALSDSVLILFIVSECLTKTKSGDYFIERAIECVNSRGCGNIISLTTASDIIIPKLLQDFSTFNYDDVGPTTENMGLPLFRAFIENKN
ncbi:IFIT5 [Branchiostoma lanceolatum]|uniref:IFIT5 protein n=1 Tax=Branchiostoma lanceolatum TaxID=7740 RepID=A0A8J9YLL6_BRALA|nr:IFIT5 [Branchiostoma lanceolatum]